MARPLGDGTFRIIDLSERSPSATIAGMLLADLGAEVIRVEPTGGDPVRALAGCQVWLRGQKSVTIGPDQVRNGQWAALKDSADVILTTAQPWTAKPAGLLDDYLNGPSDPRKIVAILTAYPRTPEEVKGPRHGVDQPVYGELIEAEYGMQFLQDGVERPKPIFLGWPHAIWGAAWLLQVGILGALFERERTGLGQLVTTSLVDGAAILLNAKWVGGAKLGDTLFDGSRISSRPRHLRFIISLFECADGNWVQVHTGPRGAFDRLMKIIGRDDLVLENASPHMLATPLDPAIHKELWPLLDRTFKTQPAVYWRDLLSKNEIACMPALDPGEGLWLKQVEDNELVDIAPDGRRQVGKIAKFSRTPMAVGRSVPAPGEHNAILSDHGAGRATPPTPSGNGQARRSPFTPGARRVGPLDGLLVLDFGFHMAGPFANRIFADLGARVIKVEEYGGDPMRGPQLRNLLGVNRGKETIAVNLKTDEGQRAILELVKRADIVHNNMRNGAMDRIGMGYEKLSALNPRLIFCHSSGYGNQGAWAKLPTLEPLHSALGGLLKRTGGEGNPPDHYLTHMDYGCGLTSSIAVLAGLIERERSGQGQFIEVPQVGAGLLAMSDVHGYRDRKSETFPLDHEQRGHAPTNAMYRTADGWIVLACYSEVEWSGVRRALGLDSEAWLDYATARSERLGRSPVARTIEAQLVKLTAAEAERRLRGEAVPCAVPQPSLPEQLVMEPTLRSRAVIVAAQHREAGEVYEVGHTVRFSSANAIHTRTVPIIGQESVEILRELGKSEAEIERLINDRIVNAAGRAPASAHESQKHA